MTTVSLKKGDATHATLKKDGTQWSVGERDWPADVTKVRKLLLDLGSLNIVEEKTRLPANYPQLGVEDVSSAKAAGTLVDVVTPARTWALIIGKSSGAKSGYVRVAGTPQSLLAAPLLSVEADPKMWLETDLIDLPAARVREVEEHPSQGSPFTASREKKEQTNFTVSPLPKGRKLTGPGAADSMGSALSALTLEDVRKADPATNAQASHAVFRTFDGLEVDLAGRKDGTHPLIAISVRSTEAPTAAEAQKLDARFKGWEFEVPDYKYAAIFMPLDELLQKPPEPATKTASSKGPAGKKGSAKAAAKSPAAELPANSGAGAK